VLARIDTRTHRALRRPAAGAAQSEDAGTSWLPMLAPTAVLAVMLALARRRRTVRTA
jgi:MYXO-CTERM domain-containing protein